MRESSAFYLNIDIDVCADLCFQEEEQVVGEEAPSTMTQAHELNVRG